MPQSDVRIIVADAGQGSRRWIVDCLADLPVESVARAKDLFASLDETAPQVVIIGATLADKDGPSLVAELKGELGAVYQAVVLLYLATPGAPEPPPGSVFYTLRPSLPPKDVRALVDSAIKKARAGGEEARAMSATGVWRLQKVLDVSQRLAVESDLERAGHMATDALIDFLGAVRAHCLFHDAESGSLFVAGVEGDERAAEGGIAGFAARTGRAIAVARAASDPRYLKAIDDPTGSGEEQLAAQPVAGPNGEIHAVLVAVRERRQPPFSGRDLEMLASLAEQWGPLLHQLALRAQTRSALEAQRRDSAADPSGHPFREQALEVYLAAGREGDVLRIQPGWMRWAYWALVLVFAAFVAYAALGSVREYASGPAVIRQIGRVEVTAPRAGTVTSIEVVPGQPVDKGQVLARFYDAAEAADLARLEEEFQNALIERMRDLADDNVRRTLASKKAELERARAQVEERTIRAREPGTVGDVRAHPGENLEPGAVILAITRGEAALEIVGLLPGQRRPQLQPGQRLRFALRGERGVYADTVLGAVDAAVVGPQEARRTLGPELADTVSIPGPVVVVRARLPRATFAARGQLYRYHDGMSGQADVVVDRERIAFVLFPGLKEIGPFLEDLR